MGTSRDNHHQNIKLNIKMTKKEFFNERLRLLMILLRVKFLFPEKDFLNVKYYSQ